MVTVIVVHDVDEVEVETQRAFAPCCGPRSFVEVDMVVVVVVVVVVTVFVVVMVLVVMYVTVLVVV